MSEDLLQAYSVVRSESKTSSNEITAARRHQTETSQSVLSLIITSTRTTISYRGKERRAEMIWMSEWKGTSPQMRVKRRTPRDQTVAASP